MMFVNLSPTHESYFETLCSLRFAQSVNKIELGRAVRNVTEADLDDGGAPAPAAAPAAASGGKSPAPAAKGKPAAAKKK